MANFDLKTFLIENKLTVNSRLLSEEVEETGWENYPDDALLNKYRDYERRKYDLGAQAAKDFIYLKKELAKRDLNISENN